MKKWKFKVSLINFGLSAQLKSQTHLHDAENYRLTIKQ